MQQRTPSLRGAFAVVGCLAGLTVIGALRSGDSGRLSVKADSAVEAPPAPALPSAAFAPGEVSSAMVQFESTPLFPTTTAGQSVPPHSNAFTSIQQQVWPSALMQPKGAASLPGNISLGAGKAVPGHASEPQTATTSPSAEPLQRPEFEVSLTKAPELRAQGDALVVGARALLSRRPTEGSAPPDTEPRAISVTHAEPLPTSVQPKKTAVPSTAATAYDVCPAAEPSAVPIMHTKPSAAPVQSAEATVPSTATAASPARFAAKPQRPPSGVSSVATLLARGDALIAVGDAAAARLFNHRAATLDFARAVPAMGKTYDSRFPQAVGAIGVVADPDAAVAWHRKGHALGDEYAAPLLGGLDVGASQ